MTRAAGCSYPVLEKQGVDLYNIASQSHEKVTSHIHYYDYNQVIISGVVWREKMTAVLITADKSFPERGNTHPKSLELAVAGDV